MVLHESYMKHLAAKQPMLHRLQQAAALGKALPGQMSGIQGKQTYLVQQSCLYPA